MSEEAKGQVGQNPASTEQQAACPDAGDDGIGCEIHWKAHGRTGSGTITIALPSGKFTDSLKIVNRAQRTAFLRAISDELAPDARADVADQLEALANRVADELGGGDKGRAQSEADTLVELVMGHPGVTLFHAPGDSVSGFATVQTDRRFDTFRLGSDDFKAWLARHYFVECQGSASSRTLEDAVRTISGHAAFNGPTIQVETRVAFHGEDLVIDLADEERNVVVVTPDGWSVRPNADVPVRFLRRRGMLPLPTPVRGGSVELLRRLVNVGDDDSWVLLVGCLVAYLYPRGPYPILVVSGEQGSAKSTLSSMVQGLVDPSSAKLRRLPRSAEDLMIGAANSWLLAFDNLSGVKDHIADTLCTIATGGSLAKRSLYSNDDELILHVQRPLLLNGIDDITHRADLLDRSVVLRLRHVDDAQRQPEDVLWDGYRNVAPLVLGALMDALVGVLRNRSEVRLSSAPRMADFAKTVAAAKLALGWAPGTFAQAYERNRDLAGALSIEESALAKAIIELMAEVPEWSGTARDLGKRTVRGRDILPAHEPTAISSESIGRELRRISPALRKFGIQLDTGVRGSDRARSRLVRISRTAAHSSPPLSLAPPRASINRAAAGGSRGLVADGSDSSTFGNCPQETGLQGPPRPCADSSDSSDGSFSSWERKKKRGKTEEEGPGRDGAPPFENCDGEECGENRPNCPNCPQEGLK